MIDVKADSILMLPNDELISKFEKFHRVVFPNDYRVFIKKNNGAIPIFNTFEFNNHEYLVERFLCLLGNKKNDVEEGWADIGVIVTQMFDRLTDDGDKLGIPIIPIAVLFAGDFVCLDFRDMPENPVVCIWYHEESIPFCPVTEKISDSFGEFLSILERE